MTKIINQRLDAESIQPVLESVCRPATRPDQWKLDLDCGNVTLVTGSGLGRLVALHKRLGGRLTISNVNEKIYEVFETTRLTRLLDVRPKATVLL
jgi:anti-anti-sigma factor